MQDSMPLGTGGMVALIGCSNEIVKKALYEANDYGRLYVANDNANGQIVLSGEIGSINYIVENTKSLQIKRAIKLPVSAPFHCELISNAASVMKKEIMNYTFNVFKVPLYSNVTAEVCNEKEIKELLVTQIVSKVRWREIIENMLKNGIVNFIEIGPGNVLTNLVKRITRDATAISISKLDDLEKLDNMKL